MSGRLLPLALIALVAACGDADTDDRRGYTKAPLEEPGLLVAAEEATAMAEIGRPNLPRPPLEIETAGSGPAAGDADEEPARLAAGVTQEQYDQGRQLFSGQGGCQACHGPGAGGTQLAPDLTDAEWLNLSSPGVDEIAEIIRAGVPQPKQYPAPMPPMGGASLDGTQVRAIAAYVASLGAE